MNKTHCSGRLGDFYNGNNDLGVKECWLLKTAKLKTRYRLHIDTPMSQKSGYLKTTVPNCYGEKGYVYLDKIPDYAE